MAAEDFIFKVLIVEDDVIFRTFLKNSVKSFGYEYYEAENGAQGLEIFKAKMPHLVISDVQMPEMDGIEMLRKIKEIRSDAIVIITTFFDSEDLAIKALNAGANNYLKKPFRPKNLTQLLQKYYVISKSRTITRDIKNMVVQKEFELRFKSDIDIIPKIVDYLIKESDLLDISGLELGLNEILTNSVEHGNLEISYEDKTKALEDDKISDLYYQRLSNPEYSNREVVVKYKMDKSHVEFEIIDQGNGFNWKNIPDPIYEENQGGFHGRGIFLTRFQFDELEYMGKGNKVRLKKYLKK
ncbi:MAG: response regulator [Bacteroidales bacterium]|nr:response regulator [Bacteroidales bacterium]